MTFEEWLGNQIDERNEIYAEIGQECYDNGYQQGRLDAERDFQNSEYWNDYIQKIISDAKADAIEECIKFIKDHSGEHYIDCDGYYGGELEEVFNLEDWMYDLEKLKEQKNE